MSTTKVISFTCSCGEERIPWVEMRVEGPDAEVVAFIADAESECSSCGRTLRDLAEGETHHG